MRAFLFSYRGLLMVLVLAALTVGVWIAVHQGENHSPALVAAADPRLTYEGPYQNVHPDVTYVGDAVCAECHESIADSYRQHGMGRSIFSVPVQTGAPTQESRVLASFSALGSEFRVEERGGKVWHKQARLDGAGELIFEQEMEAQFAIGSGERGHSYLATRDGYVFQTPISWFTQKQLWDLSPGFDAAILSGRLVNGDCLFCHSNGAVPREGYINRFQATSLKSIGCERCHGPGERHVAARRNGDMPAGAPDWTVVNPRRLAHDLRESICQQCHLEGESRILRRGRRQLDFRPGLHLKEFISVVVDQEHQVSSKAVNHSRQMEFSRCYQQSAEPDKLGCISCHDPHRRIPPESRVAFYRQRCLECHGERPCSLPLEERVADNAQDSCMACHMPRYASSDIAHSAATDHRILRRPARAKESSSSDELIGDDGLASFFQRANSTHDEELPRDLAIARVKLAVQGRANPAPAVAALQIAWQKDPTDADAGEALGLALNLTGQGARGLEVIEKVLARHPTRASTLLAAAQIAESLDRTAGATTYFRRLVEVNPYIGQYHGKLARLLVSQRAYQEAGAVCDAWIQLEPWNIEARRMGVDCLTALGRHEEALHQQRTIKRLEMP